MSSETTQPPTQKATSLPPDWKQHARILDENEMRVHTAKLVENMLSTIKGLREENAKLKAQLAEAQKQP